MATESGMSLASLYVLRATLKALRRKGLLNESEMRAVLHDATIMLRSEEGANPTLSEALTAVTDIAWDAER
ncbi:MAG: hypothetical protein HYR63_10165 [Proteobacteria bacterium]|nr:hypothetical protein [Pseudomonadota bacterium]MBI3499768.1 hypothetical protein [Pseudomonadota bacterium]